MFIRKNKNRSGSVSIQIIQKKGRNNKVIKTIGCAHTRREEELLLIIAKNELNTLQGLSQSLFVEQEDLVIDAFVDTISNQQFQIIGPQLVLGKIYKEIGYAQLNNDSYFHDLVLCRLVYPGSKLKTIKYFKRHLNKDISVYTIYRYLDELHSSLKEEIEQITFEHTQRILKGQISIVFYDITTLYFEASDEDDLRIVGYSKDGKHQHPQIMIGLLVGMNGYPIGYEIFEGNTSETKTLIPILELFQEKFDVGKPIIVADAALLSQQNLDALESNGYEFILGGRLKNESESTKQQILSLNVTEDKPQEIKTKNGRLIITYSAKRDKKDQHNRSRGLKRLEKKVKTGKLTKENINNRGYNKYLKLSGDTLVEIDYDRFKNDKAWDGLKGYLTNTSLKRNQIIDAYHQLWHIEKAFRISKTDLKIRPIYHRIRNRIEAHICICFVAYAIYKELQRQIEINSLKISTEQAIEELIDIHQLTYMLPTSKEIKTKLLKINNIQNQLLKLK